MRRSPRFLPSDLPPEARRVYVGATLFFAVTFVALVWPVYSLFAGIHPRILGLPLSLSWVVGWVVAGFLVLAAVHLWEGRRGEDPTAEPDGGTGAPDRSGDGADPGARPGTGRGHGEAG